MPLPSQCEEFAALVNTSQGDSRIRIAIFDGEADLGHPCFQNAHLEQVLLDEPLEPGAGNLAEQATHIASIGFAQFDSAIPGLSPLCSGTVFNTHWLNEQGATVTSCVRLARAIEMALTRGVEIIHISCAQIIDAETHAGLLDKALGICKAQGVLVVGAADKSVEQQLCSLAACNGVLAVAKQNKGDTTRREQPLARGILSHANNALLAMGYNVPGASPGGGAVLASGANVAAMVVTSVAALLLSIQIKQGFTAYPLGIRDVLLDTSGSFEHFVSAFGTPYLFGRMNINPALERVKLESQPPEQQPQEREPANPRLSVFDNITPITPRLAD